MAKKDDDKDPKDDAETGAGQAPEADAAGTPPADVEQGDAEIAPEPDAAPEPEAQAAPEPTAEAVPEPEVEVEAEAAGEPDAGADEDASEEPTSADAPAQEPVEQLPPKDRRRRARSRHSGEARSPRSPEERHAERQAERSRKAARRRARRLQERTKAAERRAAAPPREPLAPVHAPVEGKRRERTGVVVSDKAEKTITVRIDIARRHRRYEKIVRSSSTLHAHDENNDAHEGDVVRVIESRPLSRSKRWALVDVLERAR
jgi:small subunit ribosomal protein S17